MNALSVHMTAFMLILLLITGCDGDIAVFINETAVGFKIKSEANLISDSDYELSWTKNPQAKSYSVVISSDELCADVIFEKSNLTTTSISLNALTDGQYFICVYAERAGSRKPARNNPVSLIVDRTDPVVTVPTDTTVETKAFTPSISVEDLTRTTVVWSKVSGVGSVTFSDINLLSPLISADINGIYKIKATVTDQAGHKVEQFYQFYWNGDQSSALNFAALQQSGVAADGFINASEKLAGNAVWTLVQTGADTISYSAPLDDTGAAIICDAATSYSRTAIPTAADLTVDGTYALCVRLKDQGGNFVYGKSDSILRDTIPPIFTSLSLSGAANDGLIKYSERLSLSPMWALNASGQSTARFTSALDDTAGALICDSSTLYDQSTIAIAASLSLDGVYASCVKLTDAAGNITYGKSATLIRNTDLPDFTSFALTSVAGDGYINFSERIDSTPAWTLVQTGATSVSYTAALEDASGLVVCDDTPSYTQSTIRAAVDIATDGIWVICAKLSNTAGSIYRKSAAVNRDTVSPVFTSLANANAALDGYISNSEKLASSALWSLTATGYSTAHYSAALSDTSSALVCDAAQSYLQSSSAVASTLPSDGPYASCIKLIDAAGNVSYGKSEQVIRDIIGPSLTSLVPANDAADGFINASELTSTAALWALTQTGSITTSYTTALDDTSAALVCDSSASYTQSTLPRAVDLTTNGHFSICVKLIDTLGNITYGKGGQIVRGSSGPIFGSLLGANVAADGYINNSEKASGAAVWILNQSGANTIDYSSLLTDAGGTVVCDSSQTYNQASLPVVTDITTDNSWVVCVRLTDALTNVAYGKSVAIVRDVLAPTFTSLVNANAAVDGFINDSEKLLVNSLWTLSASGQSTSTYTSPGNDSASALVCDASATYDQSVSPTPSDLIADGIFASCVKLVDAAGNITYGKSSAITRDISGPVFTSLALANAATDSYINDSEKLLLTEMWTLSASGSTSALFSLALVDTAGTLVCDSSVSYTQSSPSNPSLLSSDGIFSLCVKLVDNAGNISYGKSVSLTRDVIFPVVTSFVGANEAANLYISNAEKTSTSALLTLVASGSTSDDFTDALDDTSSAVVCNSSNTYSNPSIPIISTLTTDGAYAVCAVISDAAGNKTYAKSSQIVRDVVAPTFTSLALANDAADGFINDLEKALSSVLWTLTAADYSTATFTLAASDTGGGLTCTSSNTYSQSAIATAASLSTDGAYSMCVKLVDSAGNIAFGKADQVTRDIIYPYFSSLNRANEASDDYITASEKNATNPLFTLSSTGSTGADYTTVLSDTSGVLVCDSGKSYSSSSIPTAASTTTDGALAVCVRLKDSALNYTYAKSQQIIRDVTPPVVTVNTLSTTDTTPALSGTVNDTTASISVKVNNRTYTATNSGTGTWSIADNVLVMTGSNTYDVEATATDTHGNSATDSTSDELTITAPTFITSWKTDNTGTSDSQSISLPIYNGGTYNFVVQWGDGSDSIVTSYTGGTHSYAAAGTYTVKITGTITGWNFNNGLDRKKILNISAWGPLRLGNTAHYFSGASNLTITATDTLNTTGTINFYDSFAGCTSITTIPNITSWNMSAVTTTESMFNGATNFNQSLAGWNVSAVTHMGGMFSNTTSFNQDLTSWDVSHVTRMGFMFAFSNFNSSLANWNTANVTDMSTMFYNNTVFDQDISNWNTIKVTNMAQMFRGSKFNHPIGSWNVAAVTDFSQMFSGNNVFNQPLNTWVTTAATNMNNMFNGTSAFDQPLASWDVSHVTTMNAMFQQSKFNQPIPLWNVGSVINFSYMFRQNTFFNQSMPSWNLSSATDLSYMFSGATAFSGDISGWTFSVALNMSYMFQAATAFNSNISTWSTGSVTNMKCMLCNASVFNQSIGSWDVSRVTNMDSMLNNSTAFNQDLGTWSPLALTTALAFGQGSGISQTNYTNLLVGWDSKAVQNSVSLGFVGKKYLSGATAARANLVTNRLWIISDSGLGP
ncbi:MAG: BspA family leucine-rich repeat surface protein [Proteobacteria bacterium]|nr:MAG: BspA family leucine-rich repeat surface protein [Pseudomonadota bacterium]